MSELLLASLIFIAAVLYSSVGHGGASGYLAAMALFGIEPAVMKPTALVLNIIVSAIATLKFYRSGCFNRSLCWQFALGSIPCAFLGGSIVVPTQNIGVNGSGVNDCNVYWQWFWRSLG